MQAHAPDGPAPSRDEPPMQLHARWLNAAGADQLLASLRAGVEWEQHSIRMFGRMLPSPRLSHWMGDATAVYTYSRTRFEPRPWTPALLALRQSLQQFCGVAFNSVLLNLYRDGRDSMGWHSDDEPELGTEPLIASLSLGAPRRFLLRRKCQHADRHAVELGHGDLLLMFGAAQREWQHALPKALKVREERINLTFRLVWPG